MTTVNRSAPTLGVAIGYFAITLWAVPKGYVMPEHSVEAVAMAGVVTTNLIMEVKSFARWVASMVKKEIKEEEKPGEE